MKLRGLVLVLGVIAFSGQETAQTNEALEEKVREVASHLRCPVCQGESILDSPADLAVDMRNVVRTKLAAGEKPEQIKAYFVERYGEWILLDPKPEGFNLTVYVLPVVALLGGAFLVVMLARRWSSAPVLASMPISNDDPDLDAWDRSRPTDPIRD